MGGLLIIYTVSGVHGSAYTQQLQLVIIFIGMVHCRIYDRSLLLPEHIGFTDALRVSGASGKMM
jgi:hypothetical protein